MAVRNLTRRGWLKVGGAAALCSLAEMARSGAETLRSAKESVDHLLLGAADLDQGMAWVERRLGLRPVAGGSHPGVGTRNALLSLGASQYLEIIAPDPQQSAYNFQIDVRGLGEPRLINWAAATSDIGAVAKSAREAGYRVFGPRDGSRATPDGKTLRWKSLGVLAKFGGPGIDPVPFFIEWEAASVHPSQSSPRGGELLAFEIQHPDPAGLSDALKRLGIEAKVSRAQNVKLTATIRTPKGQVELS